MSFQPRMNSVREGISVIGTLKWRAFNGVIADLWQARCEKGARGEYVSQHPRLFIVLETEGGSFETRLSPGGPGIASTPAGSSISYMPAGMPVWTRIDERLRLKHLDLHFDAREIAERLAEPLDRAILAQPRIMFSDERIMALARMIAAECAEPERRHDLYGDGLVLALLIDLFQIRRREPRRRSSLTGEQLRRVTDFIADHCGDNIRLQELAALVDLSQSHFSHAFKAATGLPPHQWQLQARVRKGQEMLAAGDRTLTEIAAEIGFSDQAHFTRVFRRIAGETPAAWQRARRSSAAIPSGGARQPARSRETA